MHLHTWHTGVIFTAGLVSGLMLNAGRVVLATEPPPLAEPAPPTPAEMTLWQGTPTVWNPVTDVADALLALPEGRVDTGEAALWTSSLMVPGVDIHQGLAMLNALALRVARHANGTQNPVLRIAAVNKVLFDEERFSYDWTDMKGDNPQNLALWGTLQRKKGACATLPLLWYVVAKRIGWPVFLVEGPEHLFVRYDDGQFKAVVEATDIGKIAPDEHMVERLRIPKEAIASGAMMRNLTARETIAVLLGELAAHFAAIHDYGTAQALAERVLAVEPNSIAANWTLAVIHNRVSAMKAVTGYVRTYRTDYMGDYRTAVSYALTATRLGAPEPLPDNYWGGTVRRLLRQPRRTRSPRPSTSCVPYVRRHSHRNRESWRCPFTSRVPSNKRSTSLGSRMVRNQSAHNR